MRVSSSDAALSTVIGTAISMALGTALGMRVSHSPGLMSLD